MATSVLNPNAPIFIPLAYRAVEDFSDEWWELVHSSPWFREYWLNHCFSDPQFEFLQDAHDDHSHTGQVKENSTDLVALGWLKWRKPRGEVEVPRYCHKPPKFVNIKVKPRSIQQPR